MIDAYLQNIACITILIGVHLNCSKRIYQEEKTSGEFMKNNHARSVILSSVLIPIGGLLVLALCYIGYFAVYMFVESIFFPNDPTSVPAGIIRNSYAILLVAVYLILLHTKISDFFKAILLIGPMTMLIIAAILALYVTPFLAMAPIVAITVCCLFLLYKYKKPWFFYYAAAISVVAAMIYAWP